VAATLAPQILVAGLQSSSIADVQHASVSCSLSLGRELFVPARALCRRTPSRFCLAGARWVLDEWFEPRVCRRQPITRQADSVSCAPRPAVRSVPVSSFVRLLFVDELDITSAISTRPSVPLCRTSALSPRRATTIVAWGFSCVAFSERKSLDGEGSEVLGQCSPNVRWNV
jgi:hypothetical protein